MICCDSCLDWYHGKCVGITKKMGKEMEEAGNEWTCPKCKDPNSTTMTAMPLAAAVETETVTAKTPSPTLLSPTKLALSPKKAAVKKTKGPSPSALAKRKRPGSALQNEAKEEKVRNSSVAPLRRINVFLA